jgi:hypothetical protein
MKYLKDYFNINSKWRKFLKKVKSDLQIFINKDYTFFIDYSEYKLPNVGGNLEEEEEETQTTSFFITYEDDTYFFLKKENKFTCSYGFFKNKEVWEISEKEFNDIKNLAIEISDWRDDLSDELSLKSKHTSLDNLKIDDKEFFLLELNDKINEQFKEHLKSKYEFEFLYYLWESNNKNKRIIENKEIKFDRIEIDFGNGFSYAKIFTKINDEKWYFFISSDTNTSYIDLEKGYEQKDIINVNRVKKQTRKESRTFNYPHIISFDVVCYSYNTTQFINTLKEVIHMIDDKIKD